MDISKKKLIEGWSREYIAGEPDRGIVTDVIAKVGPLGGLAIWLKVKRRGKVGYYSPYYEQNPDDEQLRAVEENADAWAWMMLGATDWAVWEWSGPETVIPAH
jgi:hypothetical protein